MTVIDAVVGAVAVVSICVSAVSVAWDTLASLKPEPPEITIHATTATQVIR